MNYTRITTFVFLNVAIVVASGSAFAQPPVSKGSLHGLANVNGAVYVDDVQLASFLAPVVTNVELNLGESQRSAIESISLFFEGDVELADGAVSVVQRSTQTKETFEQVATTVSRQFINDQTIATVQFDSHVRNSDGALDDGNYQITLTGNLVTRKGVPMSSDFVFGDKETHKFYALFGDSDGNRNNDIFDLLAFRKTFNLMSGMPGFDSSMDYDANGVVNLFDLIPYRQRFGTVMPFVFGSSVKSPQKERSPSLTKIAKGK